ncbi:MAG: IS66 family insertion sequence element accessory protein TnpB [Polyangiaceae bacterium]
MNMIDLLIPSRIRTILIYPEPINMRWGTTKLRAFCTDMLGTEPPLDTAFLFTNKKQDTLLLYLVSEDGDQTLQKKLEQGAFLVPTTKPGGPPFVTVRRAAISKLFRSD